MKQEYKYILHFGSHVFSRLVKCDSAYISLHIHYRIYEYIITHRNPMLQAITLNMSHFRKSEMVWLVFHYSPYQNVLQTDVSNLEYTQHLHFISRSSVLCYKSLLRRWV